VNEDEFITVLAKLSREYKAGLAPRLDEMELLWTQLEADGGNAELLKRLHFHFHYFSGSGGSFGLPELSSESTKAETVLSAALRDGRDLSDEEGRTVALQLGAVRRIVET
jgi:chemotaxis protein histidine kinase CheA